MRSRKEDELPLIQQAQQGSLEAFAGLFERWNQPLLQYLYHILGDRQEAEDLAQDSFLRAYENLHRLGPPWDFKSWLYQIASNLTINHLKRQRRFINASDPDEPIEPEMPSSPRSPERQVEAQEQQRQIWNALGTLPTLYRQALVLREINELSYEEIRVALDCSYENARQLVHRARLRFREEYGFTSAVAAGVPRCRVLGDLLSAYHDGQLDPDERRNVEEHMRTCEDCRETEKDMKMIGAFLLGMPAFVPDLKWMDKVLKEISKHAPAAQSEWTAGDAHPNPAGEGAGAALAPVVAAGGGSRIRRTAIGFGFLGLAVLGLFLWMRFHPAPPPLSPSSTPTTTPELQQATALSVFESPTPAGGGILEIVTSTDTPTPTLSVPPSPVMMMLKLDMNANCRHGPGSVYPVLTSVLKGQQVQLIGRNNENTWWLGIIPGGFQCWITRSSGKPDGDPLQLTVLQAPPTPTPTATPKPIKGGIDFDKDGFPAGQDCNDKNGKIHPGAPETPDDKVDSNCNGDDDT